MVSSEAPFLSSRFFLSGVCLYIYIYIALISVGSGSSAKLFYRGRAGYEMIIYNQRGAVLIISYPASPSRIVVLLETLRHIIVNLKKKCEKTESTFKENQLKELFFEQLQ